jgi:site-specific DNA-methyltransferase (adenine-specific)
MSDDGQNVQWLQKDVRLNELKPFESNPRTITEAQYEKLKDSIRRDGYRTRIEATHDLRVCSGHQRLRALRELGYQTIPVLVPSEPIDDEAFMRIVVTSNVNNGAWDFDSLSSLYDLEELRDFGVQEIMNIPPMDDGEPPAPGKTQVCCPKCSEVFTVKGNKHKGDL